MNGAANTSYQSYQSGTDMFEQMRNTDDPNNSNGGINE